MSEKLELIDVLTKIKRRKTSQQRISDKHRSIDIACIKNKEFLINSESKVKVEQQRIAIESEARRLKALEREQVREMRKFMSVLSCDIENMAKLGEG
mgnify:CR=1 FL=1